MSLSWRWWLAGLRSVASEATKGWALHHYLQYPPPDWLHLPVVPLSGSGILEASCLDLSLPGALTGAIMHPRDIRGFSAKRPFWPRLSANRALPEWPVTAHHHWNSATQLSSHRIDGMARQRRGQPTSNTDPNHRQLVWGSQRGGQELIVFRWEAGNVGHLCGACASMCAPTSPQRPVGDLSQSLKAGRVTACFFFT